MGVTQAITRDNYRDPPSGKVSRVYPIDKYDIPSELEARALEYHILKVPLLGQFSGAAPFWCGRTSSSMAYNYYQLIKGGSPRDSYITHWNAGNPGWILDLRYPDKKRAFLTTADAGPRDPDHDLCALVNSLPELVKKGALPAERDIGMSAYGYILSASPSEPHVAYADVGAQRRQYGLEIAQSPVLIDQHFKPVLDVLRAFNPLVLYSGFTRSKGDIHLILIVGYAYLPDRASPTGRSLWIAIADPATELATSLNEKDIFHAAGRTPAEDLSALVDAPAGVNLIRLINGSWAETRGSLALVRAAHFFEERKLTKGGLEHELMLDYWTDAKGGKYLYKPTPTDAPPEAYESSLTVVQLPFDARGAPFRPVTYLHDNESTPGGFFPLGSHQNVHGGVHLTGQGSAGLVVNPTQDVFREVRAPIAGSIVAIRLRNALPSTPPNLDDAKKQADAAQDLAGNQEGFVLLRHTVHEKKPDATGGADQGQKFVFYSLLMHLAAPTWPDPTSTPPPATTSAPAADGPRQSAEPYAGVPWVNALGRCHGAAVVFDPAPMRRYLTDKGAQAAQPGEVTSAQAVEVLEDGALQAALLQIAAPAEGVEATAVIRGPDAVMKTGHDALTEQHSQVATFDDGILPVKGGDLLGFVHEASKGTVDSEGFLHWEILAPSGSGGVKDFLTYALGKLTPAGTTLATRLATFEETNAGNLLDADTFASLGQYLPTAEQQKIGDTGQLHYSDTPELVAKAMNSPQLFSFADGAPPAGWTSLAYQLSVALAPGDKDNRSSFPSGDETVVVTFDVDAPAQSFTCSGGSTTAKVFVPGNARQMTLASASFHGRVGAPDPAGDVPFVDGFASRRWRSLVVDHPNEWTEDGLKATLEARHGDGIHGLPGDPATLADAMAWWGHNDVDTGKALFSGPLSKDAKLENAHPVLVMWLLRMLCDQGLAEVETPVQVTSPESKPTRYLGWAPAWSPPGASLRMGESVTAIAIASGDAYADVSLKLKLTQGSAELVLAEKLPHCGTGLVGLPLELPVWGKWTLAVDGETPSPIGSLDVTGQTPVLDAVAAPVGLEDGRFRWTLSFTQHCPKKLRGYVMLVTSTRKDPTEKLSGYAVPVELVEAAAVAPSGLTIDAGFITDAVPPTAHVSASFTFAEYTGGGGDGSSMIAVALVDAVQKIRTAYGRSLALSALDPGGLSVTLTGGAKDKLQAAASAAGVTGVTDADKGITVTVSAPAASEDPGSITFELDPTRAIGAALDDAQLAPDDELHVRFGLLLPNGGVFAHASLRADPGKGYLEAVDYQALRGSTDPPAVPSDDDDGASTSTDKVIEAWPKGGGPVVITQQPAFGAVTATQVGANLVVSAPLLGGSLGGSLAFWKAAQPRILVGSEKLGGMDGKGKMVTASIPMVGSKTKAAYRSDSLTLQATATVKGVPFHGASVDVDDSDPLEVSTVPSLTIDTDPDDDDGLVLTAHAIFDPPRPGAATPFVLTIDYQGKSLPVPVKYAFQPATSSDKPLDRVYAFSVPRSWLSKHMNGDASRTFTVTIAAGKTSGSTSIIVGQPAPDAGGLVTGGTQE